MNSAFRSLLYTVAVSGLLAVTGCQTNNPGARPAVPSPREAPAASGRLGTRITLPGGPRVGTYPRPELPGGQRRPGTRTPEGTSYRLKSNDQLIVNLLSIPEEQRLEDVVDNQGNISLPLVGALYVVGKTAEDLERTIRFEYISQKFYKDITVQVVIPNFTQQSYFIRGEVRQSSRYPLIGEVMLSQAISTAGGYTDYADAKKVSLIRYGEKTIINMKEVENNPDRDILLQDKDSIIVPRSIW